MAREALLAALLTVTATIMAVCSVHLIAMLQAGGASLAAAVAPGALVEPPQVGARVVGARVVDFVSGGRHHPIWTLHAAAGLIAARQADGARIGGGRGPRGVRRRPAIVRPGWSGARGPWMGSACVMRPDSVTFGGARK